ncbi:flagellar basal body P-ring formation chaperone FlgA [Vibrio sp. YMD68]|uniref:flagellar basal body P-ring formation chaperone FlgA n=1 Tax=Vibrio sp. YMD68 TaxID=3042300 RepID=UPI00249AD747|nr:flagellar basal body P-ring formation chaperone FlgA [Vibrio sp. YMD68]WGV99605.1 flagellar basal body P-ring formation chaperone FlgA [Vibrio sp. YMD68]
MIYSKSHWYFVTITKCRAFYKFYCKSIGFLLILFSFFSYSATNEQIEAIQQSAENYILNHVEHPVGGQLQARAANIDSRVFATDCPAPLLASSSSLSNQSSNITVLIECSEDNWRLYVPVRITTLGPQVTLSSPLNRGEIISANDVTISMVDLHRFRRQGFSSLNMVIGAKVKRNLNVGSVIQDKDICVVCRNETVVIRAVKEGMAITTKGIALSDGVAGEQIRVKNSKSNRIIEGRVTGINQVTVQF